MYTFAVIALLIESVIVCFAKGWASFFLVPITLISTLIMIISTALTGQLVKKNSDKRLLKLNLAVITLFAVGITCAVGGGDTTNTFVYGFFPGDINSAAASISSFLSAITSGSALLAGIVEIIMLIVGFSRARSNKNSLNSL